MTTKLLFKTIPSVGVITALFFALTCSLSAQEAPTFSVASMHPLISDLAQNVGGKRVAVIPIVTAKDDPHAFQPTASDLRKMASARLILVSGKGLETYVAKLKDNLRPGQSLVEVGRKVPSIKITAGDLFLCCPAHSEGSIDPHWWHSIDNMKRAASILADEFAGVDPAGGDVYKAQAKAYQKRLDDLKSWGKKEMAQIPRSARKLVTAHAAFGYLCKEFGFQSVPVRGLTPESEPSSQYLAETVSILKRENVKAVFPEAGANPKVLEELVRATGAKVGGHLIADGSGNPKITTYEGMMQHNISVVVKGLK